MNLHNGDLDDLDCKGRVLGAWIYIMLSSSDYGRVKIGRTGNNPLIRYRQLRTGDPGLGFLVGYFIPEKLGSASSVEADIHFEFQDYRVDNHEDGKTEWFKVGYDKVEIFIDEMLENWFEKEKVSLNKFDEGKISKLYEEDLRSLFEPDPNEMKFIRDVFGGK